jgi:hypothetical protein
MACYLVKHKGNFLPLPSYGHEVRPINDIFGSHDCTVQESF